MAPEVKEGFIHVEGKLYDTDNLAKLHPGGQMFIKVTYDGIYLVETKYIFCKNLNPGIARKFRLALYIFLWQSSLFKLA